MIHTFPIYIYIYIYIYTSLSLYIYIYIYSEREREGEVNICIYQTPLSRSKCDTRSIFNLISLFPLISDIFSEKSIYNTETISRQEYRISERL